MDGMNVVGDVFRWGPKMFFATGGSNPPGVMEKSRRYLILPYIELEKKTEQAPSSSSNGKYPDGRTVKVDAHDIGKKYRLGLCLQVPQ